MRWICSLIVELLLLNSLGMTKVFDHIVLSSNYNFVDQKMFSI